MIHINGSAAKLDNIIADTSSLKVSADLVSDHIHGKQKVIPTQAAAITLLGTSTAWELGAKVNIGTSVITEPFDFHYLNVESMGADNTFEIVIYEGATNSATEICRTRVTRTAAQLKSDSIPIMTPVLTSAKPTCGAVCQSSSSATSVSITLAYHTY